ncbi:uncharacterized protein LOC135495512 isoform X3 [Lineus longissimus]|uniref:uncharacterized protein LOC135495512 isoform X3 n=1 Tax=Lineus longissimus TaxID=88925 RepID=UPI00315CEC60
MVFLRSILRMWLRMCDQDIEMHMILEKWSKRLSYKTGLCMAWVRDFFLVMGEHMPNKKVTYLPGYTKRSVFRRLERSFRKRYGDIADEHVITYQHLCSVWKRGDGPGSVRLICGKPDGFTKCTTCTRLHDAAKAATTQSVVIHIEKSLELHYKTVGDLRLVYHKTREQSQSPISRTTTVIIDGMDQNKTNLPHLTTEDKTSKGQIRLKTHITGIKIHCSPTEDTDSVIAIVYVDVNEYPHDSNLTISILLDVLLMHHRIFKPKPHLQMDNCWRENKNRYILSFLFFLVHIDVFEDVSLNFLPVGHTHEDVDQMFRCINTAISSCGNINTLDEFMDRLTDKDTFSPKIEVHNVQSVFNWRDHIIPFLPDNFSGQSKPHQFQFRKVDGQARMRYRLWADDPWSPEGPGMTCLEAFPDLADEPAVVEPSSERMELDEVRKGVKALGPRLVSRDHQWWDRYFLALENPNVNDKEWPLPKISQTIGFWEIDEDMTDVPQHLLEIRSGLTQQCPAVIIGNQGQMPAIQEVDRTKIEIGDLAAIYTVEKEGRPWIAKVIDINEDTIKIHWFHGSWNGVCRPWYNNISKKQVPWLDEVHVTSVVLWGFRLTEKGACLTRTVARELKDRYPVDVALTRQEHLKAKAMVNFLPQIQTHHRQLGNGKDRRHCH